MENPSTLFSDKDQLSSMNKYINHKTGKEIKRPFSGIKRIGSVSNQQHLENQKLTNFTNSKIKFGPDF